MTTLFSIHLLVSKCPNIMAIAKQSNTVQLCELVAIRRRDEGTGSTALSTCIESYDKTLRKRNVGDIYNC